MAQTNDAVLKERFGRVVHCENGPYIGRNGIGVEKILNLVDRGIDYDEICDRLKGVEKKDILACEAYRVRFFEDELGKAYPDLSDDPYFIIDENISYLLLPEMFRLFGKSTSVLAEGLYYQRNSDEHDVWKFAVDNKYKAVLTNDSDFRGIAKRARSGLSQSFNEVVLPKVFMIPHGLNIQGMAKLLENNKSSIDSVISDNEPFATCKITMDGLNPLDWDEKRLCLA